MDEQKKIEWNQIRRELRCGCVTVYDVLEILMKRMDCIERRVAKLEGKQPELIKVDSPSDGVVQLQYDGTMKTFECGNWSDIEEYIESVDGNEQTDAGENYKAIYTLKEGCVWDDDTTEPKEVIWSIAKAANVITWSTTPSSSITIGGSVSFAATATSGSVKFYKGSVSAQNEIISPYTPTSVGSLKIIAVNSGADANHNTASNLEKSVSVNEVSYSAYCGSTFVATRPTNENIADSVISLMGDSATTKRELTTIAKHSTQHDTVYSTESDRKVGQFAIHFFLLPKMNAYSTWKVQQCFAAVGGVDEDLTGSYGFCTNVEKTYNGKVYRVYAVGVPNGNEQIDFCLNS